MQITLEQAIQNLPKTIQQEARTILSESAVIPAEAANRWAATLDIEIGHLMIMLLPTAAAYARVPISNFHVGAVALGMPPGSLYLGSNMEFTGEALSFGVHGEQSATNNAWLHGETGLQALAINAAPCGYCRQFLYEITTANKGFNILLKKNQKDPTDYSYTSNPLTYYLPDAFGPEDLHITGALMSKQSHGLSISSTDSLQLAALDAANQSYSPYTYDYAAVALLGPGGVIYSGRYAENAAYNPSMSPLESALAYMNMNLAAQTQLAITEAVLIEALSECSQKNASMDVLSSVAPSVSLQYFIASV